MSYSVSSQLSQMSEDLSAVRDQHNTEIQNLQTNLTSLTKEKDELLETLRRTREEEDLLRQDLQKSEQTVSVLIWRLYCRENCSFLTVICCFFRETS